MRAIVLAVAFLAGPAYADLRGHVASVHNGDTITLLVDGIQVRVRLIDIAAPELAQPFGKRSWQSLARICSGQDARVSVRGKDRNARTFGQVTCGVVDANAEQVRRGMAWVFVRAPKRSALHQFQNEAQLERRGLWSDAHQPVPPWEWRLRHRDRSARPLL